MVAPRTLGALALLASIGQGQSQEAYLKAFNSEASDSFGSNVAIDGDTVVVGAAREAGSGVGIDPPDDNAVNDAGAAYVFVDGASGWTFQAYLKASNTGPNDSFGARLATSGDTIVVGATGEDSAATGVNGDETDDSALDSGAVYVFVRNGTIWSQQAYLKASNAEADDRFGTAVAISGDTIVVGAARESSQATGVNGDQNDNSAPFAGAVYVFVRSGSTWTQQGYLKGHNTEAFDGFGGSVAIDADTILVGAASEDGSTFNVNGADDNEAPSSGAAYVFVRNGTTWSQEAYLKASNTGPGDVFGGVDIDGDTAVVGANGEASASTGVDGDQDDNSVSSAGAAYVFHRQGTVWTPQAYLKPVVTDASDRFGLTVAIAGDRILVGAPHEDSDAQGFGGDPTNNLATLSGAVTLFKRCGDDWYLEEYVKTSNSGARDFVGNHLAAVKGRFALCAPGEASSSNSVNGDQLDNSAIDAGAVFVFEDGSPSSPIFYCTAKTSSVGCVSSISTSIPCAPPRSGVGDYAVTAQVQELKNGLLFASIAGAAAIPFNGGTLCMTPPLARGPAQASGGDDLLGCDGVLSTTVNDGIPIPAGLDAGSGQSAWYQYWYRDPQNGAGALGTALSNAVQLDFE